MNELTIIYVALLNEGVATARPAMAIKLGRSTYRLLGPVPENEVWQFQPGEVVYCEAKVFQDSDRGLLALRRAKDLALRRWETPLPACLHPPGLD